MRRVFVFLLIIGLFSSCAPLSLNRTAQPVPAGETSRTVSGGWAFSLVANPSPADACAIDCVIAFIPREFPANFTVSLGADNITEVNFSAGFNGVRLGGKSMLWNGFGAVALDYGVFLSAALGVDAGVILSVPLEGAEPYLALRGFGMYVWSAPSRSQLNASGTLGVRLPVGLQSFFVELTFVTQHYVGPASADGLLGWALVPSIAFRF